MARMPTFEEIRDDFARGVRTAEQAVERPFRHDAAPQTPATVPATMDAAPAAATAPPQGDTMSLDTLEADLGKGFAAVKNEAIKFEQSLPAIVADAKKIASSPLGKLAITGAEHVAQGVIPPEALAIVESNAIKYYNDLFALYNPPAQQGQTTNSPLPPAQAQQPTDAQAQ